MRKKIVNLVEIIAFAAALIISAGVFHKNTEKEILMPDKYLTAGATTMMANIHQEARVTAINNYITAAAPVEDLTTPVEEEVIEAPAAPILDPEEYDLLVRTVYAESYTMGKLGMQYICDVIINRAEQNDMTITEAIYQKGVFTVVTTGAIWRQDPLPLAYQAVDAELAGPRLDTEILYFRTKHYHSFGTPCFHYKNVYFSK